MEFRFNRPRKNHFGTPELRWSARLGERDPIPQNSRARLAGWARRGRARGPKFEVFETSNPELRIVPFSPVSRFMRHGLWCWRTFSASGLRDGPLISHRNPLTL